VHCGICNHPDRYGGHGQTDHLMWAGAYEYRCWNGVTIDGPLAAEKPMTAILGEFAALPDYDEALTGLMESEIERLRSEQNRRKSQLERMRDKTDRELGNIRASLRQAGPSTVVIEELKDLESRLNQIRGEPAALDRAPEQMLAMPSLKENKDQALHALLSLARTSPEFDRLTAADHRRPLQASIRVVV
jgi:hypothetical protein